MELYGVTLTVVGWSPSDHAKLADPRTIEVCLDLLVEALGLTSMAASAGGYAPVPHDPSHRGWTMVRPITESHIAIHTYPYAGRGAVIVELLSCKPYNPNDVVRVIVETFTITKWEARTTDVPAFPGW